MKALISFILAVLLIAFLAWKLCYVRTPATVAALPKQWHEQMYGLDEGEVMRFVTPPSVRLSGYGGSMLHWVVPGQSIAPYYTSDARNSFWCVWLITLLRDLDVEIPRKAAWLPVAGDWVVRPQEPAEKKLRAMVSLMSRVSGRNIVLERELVERDVLLAQGEWSYKPLATTTRPHEVQLTLDGSPDSFRTAEFTDFLRHAESLADRRIIDEISGKRPQEVSWKWKSGIIRVDDSAELDRFIANLERQTSLKFVKARRRIWMWLVRERSAAMPPRGADRKSVV